MENSSPLSKFLKKRSSKSGMPPGALVHVGERRVDNVKINVTQYNANSIRENDVHESDLCIEKPDSESYSWIHINGLHADYLEKIGNIFSLHPLVLEDILNTNQRPKAEDHENYYFIVLRALSIEEESAEIHGEQISIILGTNYVISIQESDQNYFASIKERLLRNSGRLRKEGSDYLAYALIDTLVDMYFIVLEKFGDIIEDLEEDVLEEPDTDDLYMIQQVKREILYLRKSIWPLRELVIQLERPDSKLIKQSTRIYLRDVYDHTIQIIDTIEAFRDMLIGILDIYMSGVSFKMNSVMKVLTVITTIFMPVTFIAGVYGMNFKYMPELESPWGYPSVLGVMIMISFGMLYLFRKKGWL